MLSPAPIADDARPRLARGVRFETDAKTSQAVLLYPEGILELNETAQEILAHCNGATLREISADLARQYDVDFATLAADVREVLADLHRRKLIDLA